MRKPGQPLRSQLFQVGILVARWPVVHAEANLKQTRVSMTSINPMIEVYESLTYILDVYT